MVFTPATLSGPRLEEEFNRRVYHYRTTDNEITVTGAGYFVGIGIGGVNDCNARLGDYIDVELVDSLGAPTSVIPYFLAVTDVDADGTVTAAPQSYVLDAELGALASVISAADTLFYFTGLGTGSLTPFTAQARSLLDDTTPAEQRATLELGTAAVEDTTAFDAAGTAAAAVAAHEADATDAHDASAISIVDAGGYFTAAEVEAALQEIGLAIAAHDQAVILKGTWDASAGSFPGSGSAQAGWSYIVSVGGTVNSVVFNVGDRIIAIIDNASTSTFASNWFKADYTDLVSSVAGKTGVVTIQVADITDMSANGRSLTSAATYAAMRALLDLEAGTDFYSITAADAAFLTKADNLASVASANTSRTNLGVNTLTDTKSADYTIAASDRGKAISVSASGAARTITLLAAATAGDGFTITIKKSDSSTNTVTIDGNSSETIDGATTYVLYLINNSVTLRCNGSNWVIVQSHLPPEYGSNAQGEYLRQADGTQECWLVYSAGVAVSTAHGNIFITVNLTPGNYPAAFASGSPAVEGSARNGTTNAWAMSFGAASLTSWGSWRVACAVSSANTDTFLYLRVKGRWY